MPSFDIVSRIEMQEVDNAVNNTIKQIATRFDFRNTKTELTLDKKEKKIHCLAADEMKMEAIREMFLGAAAKRKLDLKSFKFGDVKPAADANVKRDIEIREGIEQEVAKKIVKIIKDSKIKVQASIIGEEVRVTGKKIDELQEVIQLMKGSAIEVPLQYVNMKS